MSLSGKQWTILNEETSDDLLDILLKNRGLFSDQERRAFLNDTAEQLHAPERLKDMDKAVARIKRALHDREPIMIFGDYDVDGITSTALLYDFLKKQDADVHYTLPTRDADGYGLQTYFIERFAEQGIKLLITVDCGTANRREITLAKERGIDTVVVDHHQIPAELPPAAALINPYRKDCAYPFPHLCGSTLTFKLITALTNAGLKPADSLFHYALVVMGLIADCVPLKNENRILAKLGLKALKETDHPGLRALLSSSGVAPNKVDTTAIGFFMAPRLNAAGRLETPDHSLELLLGDANKATLLNELNQARQKLVEKAMEEAVEQLGADQIPSIIVLASPAWRPGILGLIASRLGDRFQRPTVICSDRGKELTASCRSLNDFDITGFLKAEAGDLFTAFGGHKLAGGFTLPKEHWEAFRQRITKAAIGAIDPATFRGEVRIDCELKPQAINWDSLKAVQTVAPYGVENPEPTFVVRKVKILSARPVGSQKNHVQMKIQSGENTFSAIAFRFGEHAERLQTMGEADIVFNLELNEWKGYRNLQLKVVDVG